MLTSTLALSTVLVFAPQQPLPDPPAGKPTRVHIDEIGLAGGVLDAGGRAMALSVSESSQGLTDLNGDGDTVDNVLFVYDALTGATIAPAVAMISAEVRGATVFHQIGEKQNVLQDLNGDGDLDDFVMFAFHVETQTSTSSRLSVNRNVATVQNAFALSPDEIVLLVSEPGEGVDLNGDGDVFDRVLHHWNLAAGKISNLGLDVSGAVVIDGSVAFFRVDESPGLDLNGDGDFVDSVLHLFKPATGLVANLRLACSRDPVARDGLVAIFVSERFQGMQDLNGDGDVADVVLSVGHVPSATVISLGLAVGEAQQFGPHGFTVFAPIAKVGADHVAFQVDEAAQGGADLNGDGDASDQVLFLYSHSAGATENMGLPAFEYELDDDLLAFEVLESAHGATDLNENGAVQDLVVFTHGFRSGTTENLGLAKTSGPIIVHQAFQVRNGRTAFQVSEPDQGVDLNGDGDVSDPVLHVFDVRSGLTNTAFAASEAFLTANTLYFAVREGFTSASI